ncbi:MAG: hypothetical protein AB8B63_19260 [Granulosicoccus sp.]
MHFVLGLVLTIVVKVILLKLLAIAGIGLGGLNPFMWRSKDKPDINPGYQIDNPMEATAVLVTATAGLRRSGDSKRKEQVLSIFIDEIGLNKTEAARLLDSSFTLLGTINNVEEEIDVILEPSLPGYTRAQAESAVRMIEQASALASENSQSQRAFVDNVSAKILQRFHRST